MTLRQGQDLLHYLGFPLTCDGVEGPETRRCIREFQTYEKLPLTELLDDATQKALKGWVATDRFRPGSGPQWWGSIRYFRRDEPCIACSCGSCGGFPAEPQETLMQLADQVREHFGAAMIPTSTIRCSRHNTACGGVVNSRHLSGKAMDFRICGKSAQEILGYVGTLPQVRYAYTVTDRVVHMDID